MVDRSKAIKVGFFAVLTLSALYIGFNYLRGLDVFSPKQTYYVKFNSISGLSKGNRVILNGLEVGSVAQRKFSNDRYNEVIVTLYIDRRIKLKEGTVARLSRGVLGTASVSLIINHGSSKVLAPKDTLIGEIDGGLSQKLSSRGLEAVDRLTTLAGTIHDVLEPFAENKEEMSATIQNFRRVSDNLVSLTNQAGVTLQQMSHLTASMTGTVGTINPLLIEYTTLGKKLNAIDLQTHMVRLDSILAGTETLLSKINSGEGMMGQLMTNDSLYHSLNKTLADLDSLFINFRQNPKRYVHFSLFGRKNQPPAKARKK